MRRREDSEREIPTDPSEWLAPYRPLAEGTRKWRYLEETRGLSRELILSLQPHEGPEWTRIYFPFYMPYETIPVYFIGRTYRSDVFPFLGIKGEPAYRNPSSDEFPYTKAEVLWGLHRLSPRETHIILCEGIFDAVWEANRIALCGKSISLQQVALLQKLHPEEVTVMLDGDAERDTVNVCKKISRKTFARVSYVSLPRGEDPDSMSRSLKGATMKPGIDWFLKKREVFA